MQAKIYLKVVALILVFFFLSEFALASMRCGTSLITAGGRSRMTHAEVERLCGAPYSKSGGTWIYYKGSSVYRLKFSDSGLREIYREMKR